MLALKPSDTETSVVTSLADWTEKKIGQVHARKSHIYYQGDAANRFYKVKTGVVMIYRLLEDSQRQITGFCTPGDFFGMSPDSLHHDAAMAVSTSSIASLTLDDIAADASLQTELFNRTCRQLEEAQNMMMTLTKKSSAEKIAAFLIMLAQRQCVGGVDEKSSTTVTLPMSRLDIADYLGLTIETVSRRLTDLKAENIIDLPDRNSAKIYQFKSLLNRAGALS